MRGEDRIDHSLGGLVMKKALLSLLALAASSQLVACVSDNDATVGRMKMPTTIEALAQLRMPQSSKTARKRFGVTKFNAK